MRRVPLRHLPPWLVVLVGAVVVGVVLVVGLTQERLAPGRALLLVLLALSATALPLVRRTRGRRPKPRSRGRDAP
ncbi:hypothetical protein KC207_15020 [Phycicoccus sp. BSK3Z-2]|uniref:Uncharacterized protein n=1 Tax=Phycicoccus avicenniae TaxID=2828860 RepID=A0A941I1S5_9MICO|nr:hypothetical protein [Phycicoccus avicenniae]MBR7744606.1 hypothetical protein [Phycicoccus avicenniae]